MDNSYIITSDDNAMIELSAQDGLITLHIIEEFAYEGHGTAFCKLGPTWQSVLAKH